MSNEVKITLNVDDKGTATVKRFSSDATDAFEKLKNSSKGSASSIHSDSLQISSGFSSIKNVLVGLGAVAGLGYLATQAFEVGKECIKAGSDVEKMEAKFRSVFTGVTEQAETWANKLNKSYSMSNDEAMKYLSSTAQIAKATGLNTQAAGELSNSVVQLAADMGSFNNQPTEEVLTRINTALTGRTKQLRDYGIVISESMVKQEALNKGYIREGQEITTNAKLQATWNLIMEQAKGQVGDMSRQYDSYANISKRAKANTEDLTEEIGLVLIPYVKVLKGNITELTGEMAEWIKQNKGLIQSGLDTFLTKTAWLLGAITYSGVRVYETFNLMHAGSQILATGILRMIGDITGAVGNLLSLMPRFTIYHGMGQGLQSISNSAKDLADSYNQSFNSILEKTANTSAAVGDFAMKMLNFKSDVGGKSAAFSGPAEEASAGAGSGGGGSGGGGSSPAVVQANRDQEKIKEIIARSNSEINRLTMDRHDLEIAQATDVFFRQQALIEGLKVSSREKNAALAANDAEFTAKMKGIEEGRYADEQKAADEVMKMRNQATMDIMTMKGDQYAVERMQLDLKYNDELARLQALNDAKLVSEENYRAVLQELEGAHTLKMAQIKKTETESIKKEDANKWASLSGSMSQMGGALMSMAKGQSKEMFEMGKAMSIASAVSNTYEMAVKSYNAMAGIPYVGPALGAAAAAAAIVYGMAQVKMISSQKYEGRRMGGPVEPNRTYLVGEQGPEMLVMDSTAKGLIIPNKDLQSPSAGTEMHFNFDLRGATVDGGDAFTERVIAAIEEHFADGRMLAYGR